MYGDAYVPSTLSPSCVDKDMDKPHTHTRLATCALANSTMKSHWGENGSHSKNAPHLLLVVVASPRKFAASVHVLVVLQREADVQPKYNGHQPKWIGKYGVRDRKAMHVAVLLSRCIWVWWKAVWMRNKRTVTYLGRGGLSDCTHSTPLMLLSSFSSLAHCLVSKRLSYLYVHLSSCAQESSTVVRTLLESVFSSKFLLEIMQFFGLCRSWDGKYFWSLSCVGESFKTHWFEFCRHHCTQQLLARNGVDLINSLQQPLLAVS